MPIRKPGKKPRMAPRKPPKGRVIPPLGVAEAKRKLVEIRKRYVRRAPTSAPVLAEIERLENYLRKRGITYIGTPPRRRLKK